ncbi:MAG: DUF2961 domain-containing protein [Clostridia bacterium]|nr:DUF2961 domain-containing protein [Clostridia bacterium]
MLHNSLNSVACLSDAQTRSISPENLTGEPGKGAMTPAAEGTAWKAARDLGDGWKVNPYLLMPPGEVTVLADIRGSGTIQHIWMTSGSGDWRNQILRIYWDGSDIPAVECPLGDFFACGWGQYAQISSLAVCVNPGKAFNAYWAMPFRTRCLITMENRTEEVVPLYYQVTYELGEVPENAAYFHAQFRRVNPLPYKEVFTLLDKIEGRGQYVGTYMAWGVNNCGWWGEGEIKFYMDGDQEYPTICGTGTEDYFCGSYNFDVGGQYTEFSTPYSGLSQVIRPDGAYRSQTRFSLYRWHLTDPIRFRKNLKVTIQALGWRSGGRYLPLQDDLAAVVYFYLDKPASVLPPLPDKDALEII